MHVVRSLAGVILIDEVDLVSNHLPLLLFNVFTLLLRTSRTFVRVSATASPYLILSGSGTVAAPSQPRRAQRFDMRRR